MKNYINYVQLVGHLGMDPEITKIGEDKSLVKLSLATNEPYKDKNGNFQNNTQWHRIIAWGGLAENMASKLTKGNHVLINGRIQHSTWENNEGEKQTSTDIVVREYLHLDWKKASQAIAI